MTVLAIKGLRAALLTIVAATMWAASLHAADVADDQYPSQQVQAVAATNSAPVPLIAIIIDDLGNQRLLGLRTINLPGPVACAIMPYTAHAELLAKSAHVAGKEVMLHLPMQPMEMLRIAGPGELALDNGRNELIKILANDLQSVPHAVGINNHMGSLLTRHPGHMRWLMEALADRGDLFFVDSFTTPASVAYTTAIEVGVPTAKRSVFLDNEASVAAISRQFELLKKQAAKTGYAIGIGHPYTATLEYLEDALPLLSQQGYQLVPVSRIVELQNQRPAAEPLIASNDSEDLHHTIAVRH
jgi:polysaccharide deacetylase 2 family uncharacterized protein YibQ